MTPSIPFAFGRSDFLAHRRRTCPGWAADPSIPLSSAMLFLIVIRQVAGDDPGAGNGAGRRWHFLIPYDGMSFLMIVLLLEFEINS